MEKTYKEFPKNVKELPYIIHLKKKFICINGYNYFSLTELKKIPLSIRLSFPPNLFAAIDKA